jgi:BirA family biotin operon repressor/biotin-[acetyl-CoA-carboxylase] ligase
MNRNLLLERLTPTWLGGILECHGVLDSTNQRARQILDHLGPAGHGAVVFADEQTGGRGRHGRSWHSPRGLGVSCSVALWTKDRPGGLPPFQLCGSLATLSAIHGTTGLKAGLKWPNDVLLRGKKVSGVIVEARFLGDSPAGLVLGIGVNLLHRTADFPPELRATATSLLLTSGREVEPETFAGALLSALAPLVEKGLENPAALVALAGPHWIHRLGDPLAVVTGNGPLHGTFAGVGQDGALLLDVDGERRAVHDGEVLRLRPAGAGAEGPERA